MRDYSLLDTFLDERVFDAHPNYCYEDENNKKIAQLGVNRLLDFPQVCSVLDVGCGTGRDMKYMYSQGLHPTGLNFLDSELNNITDYSGTVRLPVVCADQSFTPFTNDYFDCVWSRHCLEHSIMPYFTLAEYNRILKPNGICYVELPAPNTRGQHETNPNHYSVMGKIMWEQLFIRAGFEVIEQKEVNFDFIGVEGEGDVISGDVFYVYFLRKVSKPVAGYFRNEENRGVTMERFQK